MDGRNPEEEQEEDPRTMIYQLGEDSTRLLQVRAGETQPALVEVQGDSPGRVRRLKPGSTILGRDLQCDLVINQRAASRRHAEIRWSGDAVVLEDLGSTNGTRLDGRVLQGPAALHPGNLIKIGSFVFKYMDKLLDVEMLEVLYRSGTVDELTGTFNKAHLARTLAASIDIARAGSTLSLVVLDLDHFKNINDVHGHLAGDHVLTEACRIIRTAIRPEDMLGRFGGEEFMIILPDTALPGAVTIAERVRRCIAEHLFEFAGRRIPVTVSLGVCELAPAFATAEEMIAAADAQLYTAKREGRNRVCPPQA